MDFYALLPSQLASPAQADCDWHNDGLPIRLIRAMVAEFEEDLGIVKVVQRISNSAAIVKAASVHGIR